MSIISPERNNSSILQINLIHNKFYVASINALNLKLLEL